MRAARSSAVVPTVCVFCICGSVANCSPFMHKLGFIGPVGLLVNGFRRDGKLRCLHSKLFMWVWNVLNECLLLVIVSKELRRRRCCARTRAVSSVRSSQDTLFVGNVEPLRRRSLACSMLEPAAAFCRYISSLHISFLRWCFCWLWASSSRLTLMSVMAPLTLGSSNSRLPWPWPWPVGQFTLAIGDWRLIRVLQRWPVLSNSVLLEQSYRLPLPLTDCRLITNIYLLPCYCMGIVLYQLFVSDIQFDMFYWRKREPITPW